MGVTSGSAGWRRSLHPKQLTVASFCATRRRNTLTFEATRVAGIG